mgnify:FL=1
MNINKIISTLRSLREEAPTMSVGDGSGTALPPTHEPGVKKKKRKPTPVGRYGTRRTWSQFLNGNGK